MFVKNIGLQHYRNYGLLRLESLGDVNLILGQNAQGKTNLMEALFVLAMTKSHRTSKDRELISFDAPGDAAQIVAEVERKYGDLKLELTLSAKGKKPRSMAWSSGALVSLLDL